MATSNFSDDDNWMLAAYGLKYLKEGLEEFTNNTLGQQHKDFLKIVSPQTGQCSQCLLNTILPYHASSTSVKVCKIRNCVCRDKKRKLCPYGQCSQIYDLIVSSHRKLDPNWTNTDPHKWFTSHISIGTCFINSPGYRYSRSITEIDCSGILSIIINNTYFERVFGPGFDVQDIIKARDARHDIFHDPDLRLLASKLQHFIVLFMKVLEIPQILTTSSAKTALSKLTLIRDGQHPRSQDNEQKMKEFKEEALKEIFEAKVVAINYFEERVSTVEQQTEENMHMSEINANESGGVLKTYDKWKKKKKLRRDLICFYRQKYSTLSISPLFQANNAPLLKFYASPTLYRMDTKLSNDCSTGINTNREEFIMENSRARQQEKMSQPISITDVFFRNANDLNNYIYLTSDAGYGKTSFAKRLIMSWCQAHDTLGKDIQFYNSIELSAMGKFDFLFFIPLKEYREILYDVDEMIHRQLDTFLRRRVSYSFLTYVLKNKKCLIILDGMDEWIAPSISNYIKNCFEVPHFKFRETCSVLATTRLWKYSNIDIDSDHLHIELSGLEDKEAKKLIRNAVSFLNEKYGRSRNPTQFYRDLVKHNLHDIKSVPLLLMQTLCLWYDDKSLGKSRCEIYFNMVELLLRKCEDRLTGVKATKVDIETTFPVWFSANKFCCKYYAYLTALGKLSFHTLFGTNQGASLIFSQTVVKEYIGDNELQFGLDVGLLSKDKVQGKLASDTYNISYIHKTYQELLSALYIASQYVDAENVNRMIQCYCSTIENFLELSNVFIFLSGLNPKILENITGSFAESMSCDETQICNNTFNALNEYQSVVLKCYKETEAYNENQFYFRLKDVILNEHVCQADLKLIEKAEKKGILSFRLTAGKACRLKQEIVEEVLQKSTDLQQLQLKMQHTPEHSMPRFEMSMDSLKNCKQVQLLYLSGISVSSLELSSCLKLRSLHLAELQLSMLDLSSCVQLQYLEIQKIPLSRLSLPCSSLHELHLKDLNISEVDLASCVNLRQLCIGKLSISKLDLHPCVKLQELQIEFIENISQLYLLPCEHLQQIQLEKLGLSSVDLSLCKNVKQLQLQHMAVSDLQLSSCKVLTHLYITEMALEQIDLRYCKDLQELRVQHLWRLSELRLKHCVHLQQMYLHGLEIKKLDLSSCVQLEILQLREIGVTQIDLSFCVNIKQLILQDLGLTYLNVSMCTQLERLDAQQCAIKKLDLFCCKQLKQLRLQKLWRLSSLNLTPCSQLQHLHLDNLSKIHQLQLSPCEQLQTLHVEDLSISKLDMSPCVQLQKISLQNIELARLTLVPCEQIHIQSLSKLSHVVLSLSAALRKLQLQSLQKVTQLDLSPCRYLQHLHLEDLKLSQLNLSQCDQLEYLSLNGLPIANIDLSSCEMLQTLRLYSMNVANLDLSPCTQLTDIDLKKLCITQLNLSCCEQLIQLQLQDLNRLSNLVVSQCAQLQSLRLVGVPVPKPDLSHCTLLDEKNVFIGSTL